MVTALPVDQVDPAAEKDLLRTITGLQQSVEALASELAQSRAGEEASLSRIQEVEDLSQQRMKDSEERSSKKLKEAMEEKQDVMAVAQALRETLDATREQNEALVKDSEAHVEARKEVDAVSAGNVARITAYCEEIEGLRSALEVLQTQHVEVTTQLTLQQEQRVSQQEQLMSQQEQQATLSAAHAEQLAANAAKESTLAAQIKSQEAALAAAHEEATLAALAVAQATPPPVSVEIDEKVDENILKISELQSNLSESEARLMEAEEAAWKTKAECAELLYALEQEQGSLKRVSDELSGMRDEKEKVCEEMMILRVENNKLISEQDSLRDENDFLTSEKEMEIKRMKDESIAQDLSVGAEQSVAEERASQLESMRQAIEGMEGRIIALQTELSQAQVDLNTTREEQSSSEIVRLDELAAAAMAEKSLLMRVEEGVELAREKEELVTALEEQLAALRLKEAQLEEVIQSARETEEQLRQEVIASSATESAAEEKLKEELKEVLSELARVRESLATVMAEK